MSKTSCESTNTDAPEYTTDLSEFGGRRYHSVGIDFMGRTLYFLLQNMTAGELLWAQRNCAAEDLPLMGLAMCIVDKNHHRTHTLDAAGIEPIRAMDSQLFDALTDAINKFCLNQVTPEQMLKNFEAMRSDARQSVSPDTTAATMSTASLTS